MAKKEYASKNKPVTKYALRLAWRKSHIGGWPLPLFDDSVREECRRAMSGKS